MQNLIKKLLAVGCVVFGMFLFASHAYALTSSPVRFELEGDPGETLIEKLTLRNEADTTQTYYPNYYNFQAEGESGTPTFVQTKEGLSTWITAPTGVDLAPEETKTITYVVTIPKDAKPGGYFAAILYGTTPPSQKGGELAIGALTGPILLVRVNGDISESANVIEFDTKTHKHFFTALPIEFYYRFQNTGADRVKPTGEFIIRNFLGIRAKTQASNPVEGNVLPGQIRKFELSWKKHDQKVPDAAVGMPFFDAVSYQWKNFALGYFSANLNLAFGAENATTAHGKTSFFVIPWQLILIMIFAIVVTYLILRFIVRKYNKFIVSQTTMAIEKMEEKKEERVEKREEHEETHHAHTHRHQKKKI